MDYLDCVAGGLYQGESHQASHKQDRPAKFGASYGGCSAPSHTPKGCVSICPTAWAHTPMGCDGVGV